MPPKAAAAAAAAAVVVAPLSPFHKQDPGRFRAASVASTLNPENKCKWRVLNNYEAATAEDTEAAYNAERWNSPSIEEGIRKALDDAWAAEKAELARQQSEQAQEAARLRAAKERTKRRAKSMEPVKKFLKAKHLVQVHEAKVPKQPDALALENPNSLSYKNRRTKKRKVSSKKKAAPEPSPSPDTIEEAKEMGIYYVPKEKEKRQALGTVDPEQLEAAEEALAALPAAAAQLLLNKAAAGMLKPKHKAKAPLTEEEKKAEKDRVAAAKAEAIAEYASKKIKIINKLRKEKGKGPLSKASRVIFRRDFAPYHYQDGLVREGFGGSALVGAWDRQFSEDFVRNPPAPEGEVNSEAEEEAEE